MSFYNKLTHQNQLSFDLELPVKVRSTDSYFFGGNSGIGKTTSSLQHAKQFLKETDPTELWQDQNMEFIKFGDLVEMARNSFKDNEEGWNNRQNLKQIKECFYLIIDDIGTEKQTEFVDSLIYNLIDYRLESNCLTIFTSNYSLDEIKAKYHERIASRILKICGKDNIFYISNGEDKRHLTKKTVNLEMICKKNQEESTVVNKNQVDPVIACQQILIGIARTNPKMIQKMIQRKAETWLEHIAKKSKLKDPNDVLFMLETSQEFAKFI